MTTCITRGSRRLRHAAASIVAIGALAGPDVLAGQQTYAAVPASMQPFVDRNEIAGAVMLVASRDRVLHLSAVGRSDVASGRRLATSDLFWIASMTKPMTAVAVAILADEGRLAFDDPVEKHLPEFRGLWLLQEQSADRRVLARPARPITIRDLLVHTSGMGEYTVTDPHWSLAAMSRVVAREPLRFEPGSRWSYSTASFDVLGRIVEVASGTPFAEFMQRRIFDPIGMRSTTFWPTGALARRTVTAYGHDSASKALKPVTIQYMYGGAIGDRRRPALGGAGLFSSAEDVARFHQMMLNGGVANGRRILKRETVAEMTRKQSGTLVARAGMPWGLGFCIIEEPSRVAANSTLSPGTFGHGGAHGTHGWADPATGLVYVFMIQRADLRPNPDDSPMRRAYQDAVASARPAARARSSTAP